MCDSTYFLLVLDVVVAVPACYLDYVRQKLPESIGVSAQNCHKVAKGAFTGVLAYTYTMVQCCKRKTQIIYSKLHLICSTWFLY